MGRGLSPWLWSMPCGHAAMLSAPVTDARGSGRPPRMNRLLRSTLKLFMRRYPIYSGVMRIVKTKPLVALTRNSELMITRLRCGPRIVVDVSDYCGRPIYYWGDCDSRITHLCVDALRPGDTFLDIGANYGEIALAAAQRVGPSGAVHAFEPNPRIASLLRQSAAINGFPNLSVHEVALGSHDGEVRLQVPSENTGAASVCQVQDCEDRYLGEELDVQMRHAGDYLECLNLNNLRAVKIDVEGAEADILRHAEPLLRRLRPDLIAFESHDAHVPFFQRDVVRIVSGITPSFFQVVVEPRLGVRPKLAQIIRNADVGAGYDFVGFR